MSEEEFTGLVRHWAETAKHPRFKRLYTELVYQPMLEVIGRNTLDHAPDKPDYHVLFRGRGLADLSLVLAAEHPGASLPLRRFRPNQSRRGRNNLL
jgi:hypothetical protein